MTAGQSMPEEEVALVVPGAPFRVYLRTGVKELIYESVASHQRVVNINSLSPRKLFKMLPYRQLNQFKVSKSHSHHN